MTQALDVERGHRVLEIGTGSGYQAAVLGELANEVYSIEIVAPLADRARETLTALGYRNVQVRTGNGYLGWPEHAPFDRIIVTAAPAEIPPALVEQLKVGGVMAIPVGTTDQDLLILRKTATRDADGRHAAGALRADDRQAALTDRRSLRRPARPRATSARGTARSAAASSGRRGRRRSSGRRWS